MTMSPPSRAPLISVVIPTRNRAELLKRAIASVFAQTHQNLELIVVNDASTDHTREVLAAITDPRLIIIHREQNRGAAAARNTGISRARGELLAFLDDDDFWLVLKLEEQLKALSTAPTGTGWCLCGYINIEPGQVRYFGGQYFWNQLDYYRGIGDGGPLWWLIATPGWLVSREAIERAGLFDERIRSWDDWELGLRLSQTCQRVFVDQPLYVQDHINGGGLMRAERARADDMRLILDKHGGLWAGNRRVLARHWYVIGRAESLHDPEPAGRVELLRSLRLNPFKPLTWAGVALSYLGQKRALAITQCFRAIKLALR